MSRIAYNREKYGREDAEAFYKLDLKMENIYIWSDNIPPASLIDTIHQLINQNLTAIMQGTKTIDEAMEEIQKEGQVALDQALQERKASEESTNNENEQHKLIADAAIATTRVLRGGLK